MNRILIVSAFSAELNPIKKEIKKTKLNDIKLSFLSVGKGNYNMILNLTRFLEKEGDFDFIINIGVCGYKEKKYDFIQISRIINFSNNDELIIPDLVNLGKKSSIGSSEKIIINSNDLNGEEFVDMESYGFEKVCENFKIPRMILKIPVDKVGEETINFDFKEAEKYLKENIDYIDLFKKINDYLKENKQEKIDLGKYNNYFNFSFNQELIFKKLYNKYEVLTGENFDEYFYDYIRSLDEIKNTKQESRRFLDNLDKYLEDK